MLRAESLMGFKINKEGAVSEKGSGVIASVDFFRNETMNKVWKNCIRSELRFEFGNISSPISSVSLLPAKGVLSDDEISKDIGISVVSI